MPTAPSSARVARSPCSSWTWRETTTYLFSKRFESSTIGNAVTATTRPSGQYIDSSRPVTTTSCVTLMTRNSMPKPKKRRMLLRSVVTRDSSWPDCHLPWNAIGSCWRRS